MCQGIAAEQGLWGLLCFRCWVTGPTVSCCRAGRLWPFLMLSFLRTSLYSCQKCKSHGWCWRLGTHHLLRLLSICGKVVPKVISWEVAAKNSKQKALSSMEETQNSLAISFPLSRDLSFVKPSSVGKVGSWNVWQVKWSYSLWRSELAQFFRVGISLNCSFVFRAGTSVAHVSDQSENPHTSHFIYKWLLFSWDCNISHGENYIFLAGRRGRRGRDVVLVWRWCWKVCHNCQKAWVIFFSYTFCFFLSNSKYSVSLAANRVKHWKKWAPCGP